MEIDVGLVIARWLHFVSLAILFGASLFRFYTSPWWRVANPPAALPGHTIALAGYLALASGLVWVARSLMVMSDGFGGLIDPQTIAAFFLETSFGPIWMIRLVLLVAIAVLAGAVGTGEGSSAGYGWLVGLAGLALATQAWIGHAAMAFGSRLLVELTSYMTHVLCVGAWIGGLWSLARLLSRPELDQAGLERHGAVLRRFSDLGMVVVLLILASGVANTLFRLRSMRDLASTNYGWVILAKVALFACMLAFAAWNRWRLMLRLAGGDQVAALRLRHNVLIELVLGILVLGLAALLGTLAPEA
jgi:copper resistance protein D